MNEGIFKALRENVLWERRVKMRRAVPPDTVVELLMAA